MQVFSLFILILFSIVGFDGLCLDDDCGITLSEGLAFGCDRTGDVAGRQSELHGDGGSDRQLQVFDGLHKELFLCVS